MEPAMRLPILCCVLFAAACGTARADCPPAGWTRDDLLALRAAKFELADAARRDALALALPDCLGEPVPVLRDGVAFEALQAWLRGKALADDAPARLLARLQPGLLAADDAGGFRRPFTALVLSEVARTDRIEAWMAPDQRAALVADAAAYVRGVRDYRGYVDGQGWRHGVAHGADLLLQLGLNPAVDSAGLDALLAAVRSQVVAAQGHAYIHGEPGRLARPVVFIAARGLHDAAFWEAWIADVSSPAPMADWGEAFSSEAGLARLHDTRDFLQSLYVLASRSEDAALRERLLPAVTKGLDALP
jgi:hypothetical protein